jgi:hypothetical protein
MPTFRHGQNTRVFFDQYNLSPYLNEATATVEVEPAETSAFGTSAKTYIAGLQDGKVSASGMFDGQSVDGVDTVLNPILGSATDSILSYFPDGYAQPTGGAGRRAKLAAVMAVNYEVSSPVGDLVSVSAEFQADEGVWSGHLLAAGTTVSTAVTTNGGNADNAALTSNGGVAHLHVTANANIGITSFKIQHSLDNSSWADLATFTNVAASTLSAQRVVVAAGTTVNRHLRVQSITANTGAITYTAAFARR